MEKFLEFTSVNGRKNPRRLVQVFSCLVINDITVGLNQIVIKESPSHSIRPIQVCQGTEPQLYDDQ